ncbi:MAG: hypothetical protein RIG68_22580 [Imperialibacter sp.]|uniref:hypothetical protein n=1 Tax=Imperialibacter sp. TaxID=2038411 RepID=UPI0032EC4A33
MNSLWVVSNFVLNRKFRASKSPAFDILYVVGQPKCIPHKITASHLGKTGSTISTKKSRKQWRDFQFSGGEPTDVRLILLTGSLTLSGYSPVEGRLLVAISGVTFTKNYF